MVSSSRRAFTERFKCRHSWAVAPRPRALWRHLIRLAVARRDRAVACCTRKTTQPGRIPQEVSPRPLASPLARHQAARGAVATSLKHQQVGLSEPDRQLLPFVDGTRDRQALCDELVKGLHQGRLTVAKDDQPVTDERLAREVLAQSLDQQLLRFAKAALLIA
jgi:methyltransferase-like protein